MRVLILLNCIVLVSGCAFKQSEGKPQRSAPSRASDSSNSSLSESSVSYRILTGAPNGEASTGESIALVATELLLRDVSSHILRSSSSLVMPFSVPETLTITVKVAEVLDPRASFKGELRSGDKFIREIPAAAFSIKQRSVNEIEFSVTDLKQLFPPNVQRRVEVIISVLDRSGKVDDTIAFSMSTPPSKVEAKPFFPYSRYEKLKQIVIPDSFKKVVRSNGVALDLIGVLELNNAEIEPVEFSLPTKLSHSLKRIETQSQLNAGECAFSVSKNVIETKIESDIVLLPFNFESARPINTELLKVQVGEGETQQVGIYITDQKSFTLPEDRMIAQNVPIRCLARCESGAESDWANSRRWGGECLACGNAPNNVGEHCFRCMRSHREWCRWQSWHEWKEYSAVPIGTEFALSLAPSFDQQSSGSYFAAFLNQRVPGRTKPIFTETIEIKK